MMVKMDEMKIDENFLLLNDMMDGKMKMHNDKINGKMMVKIKWVDVWWMIWCVVMMKYDGWKMDERTTPQSPLLL